MLYEICISFIGYVFYILMCTFFRYIYLSMKTETKINPILNECPLMICSNSCFMFIHVFL